MPNGTVISTNPSSGTKVSQGSSVTLKVSSGLPNVQVPSVSGLSQAAAGSTIGNAGLTVSGFTQQPSTQYAAGVVIGTNPGVGTQVSPGSSVQLIVSTGPPPPTTTTTSTPPSSTTTTSSPPSSSTTTTVKPPKSP